MMLLDTPAVRRHQAAGTLTWALIHQIEADSARAVCEGHTGKPFGQ
jgi:hypothetical protein